MTKNKLSGQRFHIITEIYLEYENPFHGTYWYCVGEAPHGSYDRVCQVFVGKRGRENHLGVREHTQIIFEICTEGEYLLFSSK